MSRRHNSKPDYRFEERAEEMMNDAYWDGYEDARTLRQNNPSERRKFRRNTIDGNVGGVCAGIADYLGWDIFVVRLLFVGSLFFTGGTTFWAYVLLWICVPEDHRAPYRKEARREERREARRSRKAQAPRHTESLTDVRSKFRSIETRMQELERSITSKEWQLRRDFRDLED